MGFDFSCMRNELEPTNCVITSYASSHPPPEKPPPTLTPGPGETVAPVSTFCNIGTQQSSSESLSVYHSGNYAVLTCVYLLEWNVLFQLSPKLHLGPIFSSGPIVGQDEVGMHTVENSEFAHGVGHGLVRPDHLQGIERKRQTSEKRNQIRRRRTGNRKRKKEFLSLVQWKCSLHPLPTIALGRSKIYDKNSIPSKSVPKEIFTTHGNESLCFYTKN